MKARTTSSVKKAQESQPSAPEEEEKKSPPSAPEKEEQKNWPCLMKTVEDGQRKFKNFTIGGGKDFRPNLKEFKRDDRGDWQSLKSFQAWTTYLLQQKRSPLDLSG